MSPNKEDGAPHQSPAHVVTTTADSVTRCQRCGRPIRSDVAVALGYGVHCAVRLLTGLVTP